VTAYLLAFALELADAARAETLSRWRTAEGERDKGGARGYDPVTEADLAAECAIRALIRERHPDHGIAGEEYAPHQGAGRFEWSLDPVDGTRAFVCGLPGWTTLIALLDEGEPVLGLIDTPRLDERYLGWPGGARVDVGADSEPLRTSGCTRLTDARFATTDPYLFDGEERAAFERLRARARLTRYGFDAYAYARLAAGSIDLVVESGLKPHDFNALVPVIRGAGGFVGDWQGGNDLAPGRIVAAATKELFDEAVEAIGGKI
jgi:histidinol phosphatase-like enzyme (inositol monophosphatase family)